MDMCQNGPDYYKIRYGDTLWRIAEDNNTTVNEILAANPGTSIYNLLVGQSIAIPGRCNLGPVTAEAISGTVVNAAQVLYNQTRMLLEQHAYWVRMVLVSLIFDLPDEKAIEERLMNAPKDISSLLRQYYGDEQSSKLAELITGNISLTIELAKALKAGDTAKADDVEKRLYENADQTADFLANINSYWSQHDWREILYHFISMTKDEIVYMLDKKYEDSISMFGNLEREAVTIADMLTQGIVKQFSPYF